MRAARDEEHVGAGRRETSAEIPADPTRADHCQPHHSRPSRARAARMSFVGIVYQLALNAPALTASNEITGSSPRTAALWVTPRGTSAQSPGPSSATWPPMIRRNRPETTASTLSTPCL